MTKEEITTEIAKLHNEGISLKTTDIMKTHSSIYYKAVKRFGSWKSAVESIGLNYKIGKWTKEKIINEIMQLFENGTSLSAGDMKRNNTALIRAAENHFGGWKEAVIEAGIDYSNFVKLEAYWTKEMIIRALNDRKDKGLPLNSASVQNDNISLFQASIRHFGSYEKTIEECGWNYEDFYETKLMTSYYGYQFQYLLTDIIKEIHGSFTKGFNKDIQPDFVLENKQWIDAKLSYHTVFLDGTIEKYEPHCKTLTIVYLRGDKNKIEKLTDKTSIVSVYQYINLLPKDKINYYINKLDKLWKHADEQDAKLEISIEGDPKNPKGYIGVSWSKQMKKWNVRVIANKEKIFEEYFSSEIEAAKSYDKIIVDNGLARRINFGENPHFENSGKSRYRGVWWSDKDKRWIVSIKVNGDAIYVGRSIDEIEAAQLYNQYVIDNKLNKPLNIF